MNKLEYLRACFQHKLYHRKAWIITAFSITKEKAEILEPYFLRLLPRAWGYAYLDENLEEQKITDAKAGEPLFRFKDRINIDETWIVNLSGKLETSVGTYLYNEFCIVTAFGKKLPYIAGRSSVNDAEDIIAPKLLSTPKPGVERSTEYFYTDEYEAYVNALQDFASLSQLCAWSVTRKGITPPTGLKEFKKGLLEKYAGKLDDPVEVSKFEAELLAFDDNYLKDDPAYGTFLAGKVKNVARKKLFLTMGNEMGFGSGLKSNTVTNSLHEGWPTDAEQYTTMMNGSRIGSYSRGAETVKGGVSAKYLLRAANNFRIIDTDCGTKFYLDRTYDAAKIGYMINRYYYIDGKIVLMENKEIAGHYLGKVLKTRSPMYCKLKGDQICRICAGDRLFQYPTGLTIPLTEISGEILKAALKAFHKSGTKTSRLNLAECIS